MTHKRMLAAVLCVIVSARVFAGHGFMNSFADIEWLPEPGCTPDSFCYFFDTVAEHGLLLIARWRGTALAFALATAREKLAETSAMIKANNGAAAARAAARYQALAEAAQAAVARAPVAGQGAARERYMNETLEHVYILSVDYVDMPLDLRHEILKPVFDAAMARYTHARAALSEAGKKALFFKEEEIRWSLEMTTQADVQKITNEFAGE
ncbi:MAG: DUF5667 domain-containing protein [Gammaproteobacteria bacterium]